MHDLSALTNRLQKNIRRLNPWAKRKGLEAYRLYDRDIPEFPVIIDRYGPAVIIYDKSDEGEELAIKEMIDILADTLELYPQNIYVKLRRVQQGKAQYEKISEEKTEFPVNEGKLKFLVNLSDYLDTGLFLDHRNLRHALTHLSPGLRVLNLFCYTGSLSVAAASAGAQCTSVDLSNTYLEWAKRNFALNRLDPEAHRFIKADILRLVDPRQKIDPFDLILLDPPTFSNSKAMEQTFDVQRDHAALIRSLMAVLKPDGLMFFSTNAKKFKPDDSVMQTYDVQDVTERSIPFDFNRRPHRSYFIKNRHTPCSLKLMV